MKRFQFCILIVLFLVSAVKADEVVTQLGDSFVQRLPSSWQVEAGDWRYFDVKDCFVNGPTCFGNNPTSPYGFPTFAAADAPNAMDFKIKLNDAIVIFFRTPSKMRYFGLTQYLMNRPPETEPVFASLSDTINHTQFKVIDGDGSGQVFDKYAVLVWTGDMRTYDSIKNQLSLQGISESEINFLPLPVQLPLNLGLQESADSFGMLMRTALPEVQANFDSYVQEKPFYVLKVGPAEALPVVAAPTIGYKDEISGISESQDLQTNLNALVADIKNNYIEQFEFANQRVSFIDKIGWDCIFSGQHCAGDNHDALYSSDLTRPLTVRKLSDIVLVVGVNHQKTGEALYANHAVYDLEKMAGIVSVNDTQFTVQSALFHAGIKNMRDPRVAKYKNLYAYAISYRCGNLKHCLAIPAPTADNPVGLVPGAPFHLLGRIYVEPSTGVRPSPLEIIGHQSLVGFRR